MNTIKQSQNLKFYNINLDTEDGQDVYEDIHNTVLNSNGKISMVGKTFYTKTTKSSMRDAEGGGETLEITELWVRFETVTIETPTILGEKGVSVIKSLG